MRMKLPRSKPYRKIEVARMFFFTCAALGSAVLGIPPQQDGLLAAGLLTEIRKWGWWVVAGSLVLGGTAATWIRSKDDRGLETVLTDLLEDFRRDMFGHLGEPRGDHRVTLFVYRKFWWGALWRCRSPRAGWLTPAARAGHTRQRSSTYFRVPDDDSQAEGVAGRAWATPGRMITADNLSDMTQALGSKTQRRERAKRYAQDTYVDVEWVERKTPQSRSIAAFAIEKTNTEVWGVLALDSRNPHMDMQRAQLAYRDRLTTLQSIARVL